MRRIWLGSLAALLAAAACGGDGGPNPVGGDLLVSYYQGGPEPGAMLLTISGGAVSNVVAVGSQQVSFASPLSATTKVVVIGTFTTGDLLRIHVPDLSLSANYRVRLEQVADQTTFALIDTTPYTFTVHK
jgi:hypothetical protein